ncbi:hypothetical protein HW115_09735 [Verrucomicrobiaceae bacterium N1E253]|uniref:PEP-CTERM protein-sorting domain-containing protein n=1 Tax=Oceaniferula marina TaxID=2748318 RepID=A0A851GG56_9BACT|nr:hypothetical protein [Oceaniferula marina]NWK55892.1 hypothetical protein [Oceaniferula marina]
MKMTPKPPHKRAAAKYALAIGCTLFGWLSPPVEAVSIDLTTSINAGGEINGAIFLVDNSQPAGTGIFGRDAGGVFLRIQVTGTEQGYNTSANGVMDNKTGPFTRDLLYSTLNTVSIEGSLYVPFLLDTNEMNTVEGRTITMESLKIFSSTTGGLSHGDIGGLEGDAATTLLYDLDGTPDGDSSVLLDYDLIGRGSGAADMGVFIPLINFAGVEDDEYIVLYSSFSGADAGFEEWTPGAQGPLPPDDPGPNPLPEPSTGVMGLIGLMLILRRRNR